MSKIIPSLHPKHPAYDFIKIADDNKRDLSERFAALLVAAENLCLNDSAPDAIRPLWNKLSFSVFSSENTELIEIGKSKIIDTVGRLMWYRRPFGDEELTGDYQPIEIHELTRTGDQTSKEDFQPSSDFKKPHSTIFTTDSVTPEELNEISRRIITQDRLMKRRELWVKELPYGEFVLAKPFDLIFENLEFEGKNPAEYIRSLLTDFSGDQEVLPPYIGDNWLLQVKEMVAVLKDSGHLEKEEILAFDFLIDGWVEQERRLEYFALLARSLPTTFYRHGYFAALSRFVFTPVINFILPEGLVDSDASLAIDVYNLFSPALLYNENLENVRDELLSEFSQGQCDIPESWKKKFESYRRSDLIVSGSTVTLDDLEVVTHSASILSFMSMKYSARLDTNMLNFDISVYGPRALNGHELYVFTMACAEILDHLAMLSTNASMKFGEYKLLEGLLCSAPLENNEIIFYGLIEAAFLSHRNYCDEYLAGGSDISLFDLSELLYRFHIIRESGHDHLVTASMSLGMVLSLLTDPRFPELSYAWRYSFPREIYGDLNPNDIRYEGWLRQRYLLDVVGILRQRELNVAAAALLGYLLVTEVMVGRGELFFVDETMSHLGWASVHGLEFASVCSVYCIDALKRFHKPCLMRRVKEASRSLASDKSIGAQVEDRASLYRYGPEEEASRVFGGDFLNELPGEQRERLVDVLSDVQALIASRSVYAKKDYGSAVMVFFRFFEELLRDECLDAFSVAVKIRRSGIQKPKGEPTFGNFIRMINKVYSSSAQDDLICALKPTKAFFQFYPTVQGIADFGRLRNAAAHGSLIKSIEYWKFHDCLIHEGYFKKFLLECRGLFRVNEAK